MGRLVFAALLLASMQRGEGDETFRVIPLASVEATVWTHVCVDGTITSKRTERDRDVHVRITDGTTSLLGEAIPQIPLTIPKVKSFVRMCGITLYDKFHKWPELHPITSISVRSRAGA